MHSWKEKRAASQVVEMPAVVVLFEVVVECGGQFGDRPYCGASASAGYKGRYGKRPYIGHPFLKLAKRLRNIGALASARTSLFEKFALGAGFAKAILPSKTSISCGLP